MFRFLKKIRFRDVLSFINGRRLSWNVDIINTWFFWYFSTFQVTTSFTCLFFNLCSSSYVHRSDCKKWRQCKQWVENNAVSGYRICALSVGPTHNESTWHDASVCWLFPPHLFCLPIAVGYTVSKQRPFGKRWQSIGQCFGIDRFLWDPVKHTRIYTLCPYKVVTSNVLMW